MIANVALFTRATEFLSPDQKQMHLVHDGKVYPLSQIPAIPKNALLKKMESHPYSQAAFKDWNLKTESEQIERYVKCLHSAGDNHPDIDEDGVVQAPEFVNCDCRKDCKWNGKFCILPQFEFGQLTFRELEVTELISEGHQDEYISSVLGITKPTLRHHKNHIEIKMGVHGKVAIAVMATQFLPLNIATKKQII